MQMSCNVRVSGTPLYNGSTKKIIDDALRSALIYKECLLDGVLVENMHDVPYVQSKDLSPDTTAMMSRVCTEIRRMMPESIPCGVQILAGCNKEALAVAKATDFQFIRAEGFVFSHIADEGFTNATAGPLLRYRKQIDAENVLVFTDVKKKHSSHAITADVNLSETVKAAEFFLTDGVILTGSATGDPADATELGEVKKCAEGPVLIGSGVTADNIKDYLSSDAVIVGSHFKIDGKWGNKVDESRVSNFMIKLNNLQAS